MAKLGYQIDFTYKSKSNIVEYLIHTYALSNKLEPPSKRELGILRDYVLYGYNSEARDCILINAKITSDNLKVINSNIEKKGYLKKHPTNMTMRLLSQGLINIKSFVENINKEEDICALIRFRLDNSHR